MLSPDEWHSAFPGLPPAYVDELFEAFSEQVSAWNVHDWEKVGLKAGKVCEIAYSAVVGIGTGTFPPKPSKPSNFLAANTRIEQAHTHLPRSLKIQIPRVLIAVYELRNNRSVGHVGSAVQPNQLDGELFFRSVKWIICELSRSLCEMRGVPGNTGFYNLVNTTELPIIWEQGDLLRVLKPGLSAADKTLIVLAHYNSWIDVTRLQKIVEYANTSNYRSKVLKKLHKDKMIEYDAQGKRAMALPPGQRHARTLHL